MRRATRFIAFPFLSLLLAAYPHPATTSVISSETWVACSVNVTALQASSLKKEVFQGLSSFRCFSQATFLSWAFLACYNASKTCTIWELNAVGVGSAVKNTSHSPGITCKFPDRVLGCSLPGGTTLVLNGTVPNAACPSMTDTCTENGLVTTDNTVTVSVRTTCSAPFTAVGFGCIHYNTTKYMSWCDARKYCLALGGDLISPDTVGQYEAMRQYMIDTLTINSGKVFQAGMQFLNGKYQWLSNGRSPGPYMTQDWAPNEPSSPLSTSKLCGKLGDYCGFKLISSGCSESNLAFCELKI